MVARLVGVVALMVSGVVSSAAWAATINVAPGANTLSAAIAAASDGDTLLLASGTYTESTGNNFGSITIGKSLTIKSITTSSRAPK